MLCTQCEMAGERSRVYPGETYITAMVVQEYWDEDGVHVIDDPNTLTRRFACSRGHNWRADTIRKVTTVEYLVDTPWREA